VYGVEATLKLIGVYLAGRQAVVQNFVGCVTRRVAPAVAPEPEDDERNDGRYQNEHYSTHPEPVATIHVVVPHCLSPFCQGPFGCLNDIV